jgi:hypothetical protein
MFLQELNDHENIIRCARWQLPGCASGAAHARARCAARRAALRPLRRALEPRHCRQLPRRARWP